jgi:hypothetical protein
MSIVVHSIFAKGSCLAVGCAAGCAAGFAVNFRHVLQGSSTGMRRDKWSAVDK